MGEPLTARSHLLRSSSAGVFRIGLMLRLRKLQETPDFLTVFSMFSDRTASDARDKIFAYTGMSEGLYEKFIDYRRERYEVFLWATLAQIASTGYLDTLSHVYNPRFLVELHLLEDAPTSNATKETDRTRPRQGDCPMLPTASWALTRATRSPDELESCLYRLARLPNYDACAGKLIDWKEAAQQSSAADGRLELRGVLIDTVDVIGNCSSPRSGKFSWRE